VVHVEHAALGNASKASTSTVRIIRLPPNLPPATSNAYEGHCSTTETVLIVARQTNYIYAMYSIADRGSTIRGHGGQGRANRFRLPQSSGDLQCPLVCGSANALRAGGEKLREMMDPSFIETANEDAGNAMLEYLGRRRLNWEGDIDTALTPPRTQYRATRCKPEKKKPLRYGGLASPGKPLQRPIITRNEQASASSPLVGSLQSA